MPQTATHVRQSAAEQRAAFRPLWIATFVSAVGTGLVYPVTAIHIATDLRLGVPAVALFYGTFAVAAGVFGPLGGSLASRFGARLTAVVGGSCQIAAWTTMACVWGLPQVMVVAALSGLGSSLFFPALFSTILSGVPEELRKRTFGFRYTVINLGIAAGAGLSGLLVVRVAPSILFLANAVSFVPVILWVWRHGDSGEAAEPSAASEESAGRSSVWSRAFGIALAVTFLMSAFGAVQLESTVPLILRRLAHESLSMVTVVTVVNAVAVVLLQRLLRARVDRFGNAGAVALGAGLWVAAYALGLLATGLSDSQFWCSKGLLMCFAVVFAAGEVVVASSLTPLIVGLVAPGAAARATGTSGSAWSLGTLAGPAVGSTAVALAGPMGSWGVLAAGGAGALLLGLWLRAHETGRRRHEGKRHGC
ncbi:MFS family permease [Kitasatospora sp. MAP12-15]|uniref:MFS transporter n=1 Tax=unclassified Kitasatospora TaxID=2633591 RepID=UPI0024758DC0|nr:MFS transporter [Kitasatospora sp. MAP12-44]MDH6111723.1 MFS family permease [Kitasatospora sp. MAP12-44]